MYCRFPLKNKLYKIPKSLLAPSSINKLAAVFELPFLIDLFGDGTLEFLSDPAEILFCEAIFDFFGDFFGGSL